MKKIFQDSGFTLAELMVGAVILLVTFVGIMLTYVKCMELNEMSRNSSTAVKGVKSRAEQIKNTDFDQILPTYNNTTFTIAGLTGMGVSYVDNSNPNLSKITVLYCWHERNGRILGEDTNLNGALNGGEDKNANGSLDSPVQLVTYIYKVL